MKLKVIVTFKDNIGRGKIDKILNDNIRYKSNGSIVFMKGLSPWLDFTVDSIYMENFIYDFIDVAQNIEISN